MAIDHCLPRFHSTAAFADQHARRRVDRNLFAESGDRLDVRISVSTFMP